MIDSSDRCFNNFLKKTKTARALPARSGYKKRFSFPDDPSSQPLEKHHHYITSSKFFQGIVISHFGSRILIQKKRSIRQSRVPGPWSLVLDPWSKAKTESQNPLKLPDSEPPFDSGPIFYAAGHSWSSGSTAIRRPMAPRSEERLLSSGLPRFDNMRYRLSRLRLAFLAKAAMPPLASATLRSASKNTARSPPGRDVLALLH